MKTFFANPVFSQIRILVFFFDRKLLLPALLLSGSPFFPPPRADTLVLKNGKVYKNVKTDLRGPRIYVYRPNGRRLSFSASQIQSLTPAAVHWPKKRTEKATTKNTDNSPRPLRRQSSVGSTKKSPSSKELSSKSCKDCAESDFWQSPWMLGLQGATPLWSGLYQNQDTRYYAYAMSALEGIALLNLATWLAPPVPLQQERVPDLLVLGMVVRPPPPTPPAFNTSLVGNLYIFLSAQNMVLAPNGKVLKRRDFDRNRAGAGLFFVGLLAADALLSVLYGTPETTTKNESSKNKFRKNQNFSWGIGFARQWDIPRVPGKQSGSFIRPSLEFHWYF